MEILSRDLKAPPTSQIVSLSFSLPSLKIEFDHSRDSGNTHLLIVRFSRKIKKLLLFFCTDSA